MKITEEQIKKAEESFYKNLDPSNNQNGSNWREGVVWVQEQQTLCDMKLLQALQAMINLYENTCAVFPTLSQEKAYIEAKQVIEKAL